MRPRILFVVFLLVLLTSLTCFSQQTDIPQFSAFGAFSYLATPSLNLTQRGFDGDFGVNLRSWLTLGGDFSYNSGHSSIVPNDLNAATQAKLAPFLPFLPPGYVISIPYNSATYTYEAGPQFNYRGFKKVTLFVRPALGHCTPTSRSSRATQSPNCLSAVCWARIRRDLTPSCFTASEAGPLGRSRRTLVFV